MKTLFIAAALVALAAAQAPAAHPVTIAQQLNQGVSAVERDVVGAAEAMPAAKYDFAPPVSMGNFAGVRTFAQEVKHIAVANYSYAAAILGEKSPVVGGPTENGPDSLRTKAQIVKFLRDSYAYAHRAVDTITVANALQPGKPGARGSRLGNAAEIPTHGNDHYGQMVEYLRMNGLTPPASATSKPANP